MPRFYKILIIFFLLFNISAGNFINNAHASFLLELPEPGRQVHLSPAYHSVMLKGLEIHKSNPFKLDFIVDVGEEHLSGDVLKKEGERLIKYFLGALAIPEHDLWVNLSPFESDHVVPETLGYIDMGRDLLAQDYILKQVTASLIDPNKPLGKKFWKEIYSKALALYGHTNITVSSFNKVWIMADRAEVYENNQKAFVVDRHLKVMLDEDYLSSGKNSMLSKKLPFKTFGVDIMRAVIVPVIEKEVNTGKHFALLRQMFDALILASWYKKNFNQLRMYVDKSQVKGIQAKDLAIKDLIYKRYLEAYKKGVLNLIKDTDFPNGTSEARKYFSGGIVVQGTAVSNVAVIHDQTIFDKAMSNAVGLVKFSTFLRDVHSTYNIRNDSAMLASQSLSGSAVFINEEKLRAIDGRVSEILRHALKLPFGGISSRQGNYPAYGINNVNQEDLGRYSYIRLGDLFFIDENVYRGLPEDIVGDMGTNVIIIKDLHDSYLGYTNGVLPWEPKKGHLKDFTAVSIAAIDHIDQRGAQVIDFGAGDGITATAALKRGAHQVVLIERDTKMLVKARRNLQLNGYEEGKDFIIVSTDLNDPKDILQYIPPYKGRVIALINIGPWVQYGQMLNSKCLNIFTQIVTLNNSVLGGAVLAGYDSQIFSTEPDTKPDKDLAFAKTKGLLQVGLPFTAQGAYAYVLQPETTVHQGLVLTVFNISMATDLGGQTPFLDTKNPDSKSWKMYHFRRWLADTPIIAPAVATVRAGITYWVFRSAFWLKGILGDMETRVQPSKKDYPPNDLRFYDSLGKAEVDALGNPLIPALEDIIYFGGSGPSRQQGPVLAKSRAEAVAEYRAAIGGILGKRYDQLPESDLNNLLEAKGLPKAHLYSYYHSGNARTKNMERLTKAYIVQNFRHEYYDQEAMNFVDSFLMPEITQGLSVVQLSNKLRRTWVVQSYGATFAQMVVNALIKRLRQKGYSYLDIRQAVRNIFILAMSGAMPLQNNGPSATIIFIEDVKDYIVFQRKTKGIYPDKNQHEAFKIQGNSMVLSIAPERMFFWMDNTWETTWPGQALPNPSYGIHDVRLTAANIPAVVLRAVRNVVLMRAPLPPLSNILNGATDSAQIQLPARKQMAFDKGGIDLNTDEMDLVVRKSNMGGAIDADPVFPAWHEKHTVDLVPIVGDITPMINLRSLNNDKP